MSTLNCEICLNKITYSIRNFKKYNSLLHIVLCNNCTNNNILLTKDYCKNNLYLNDNDIVQIKFLFNPYNNKKLYPEQFINKFYIEKFGTKENIELNIEKKESSRKIREIKKKEKINERRNQLLSFIYDNKLNYNEAGICYTYINYGFPSLQEVYDYIIKQCNMENHIENNNIKLSDEKKHGEPYINAKGAVHQKYSIKNMRARSENKISDNIIVEFN